MAHLKARESMAEARFRFYAELNDYLSPERRFVEFVDAGLDGATVQERIESLGVPHTEVDLVLINGQSVGFERRVRDGDRISVYPVFEAFDIAGVTRLRPEPLREPRFVLDTRLGRLADYLRMMGFDAVCADGCDDERLAEISRDERRILLTRDSGLLARSGVTHGAVIQEDDARGQVEEVVRRFDLGRRARRSIRS